MAWSRSHCSTAGPRGAGASDVPRSAANRTLRRFGVGGGAPRGPRLAWRRDPPCPRSVARGLGRPERAPRRGRHTVDVRPRRGISAAHRGGGTPRGRGGLSRRVRRVRAGAPRRRDMSDVSISGGVGGTHARTEDLARASAALDGARKRMEGVAAWARAARSDVRSAEWADALVAGHVEGALDWVNLGPGGAEGVAREIDEIARGLAETVRLLEGAERNAG